MGVCRTHAQSKTRGLFTVNHCYVSSAIDRSIHGFLTVRVSIVSVYGRRNDTILVRCSAERFPRFFSMLYICVNFDRRGLCYEAVLFCLWIVT